MILRQTILNTNSEPIKPFKRRKTMALSCDEKDSWIHIRDGRLMAGTRSDVNFFKALCKEALDKIPESERMANPCNPKNGGVDIHDAHSTLNFDGYYLIDDFVLRDFCFSISQKTAEQYLPNHIKHYNVLA
jgi:hypothetical protein